MGSRSFISLLFYAVVSCYLAAALFIFCSSAHAQITKPNIVVIMADDLDGPTLQRLFALGYMPNLRQLAAEGVTFENNFVTNSLCCPSRATFLTGQYPHNH